MNDDIAAQNAVNAELQQQIDSLAEAQALQAEAASKQQLLSEAYAGEVSFSQMLMDMSRVIPSDAYLSIARCHPDECLGDRGDDGRDLDHPRNPRRDVVRWRLHRIGWRGRVRQPRLVADTPRIGPWMGEPLAVERDRD